MYAKPEVYYTSYIINMLCSSGDTRLFFQGRQKGKLTYIRAGTVVITQYRVTIVGGTE